jgi:UDP-glucose:(heptosyl)LPS alpha-1,3-glucosyltransferase
MEDQQMQIGIRRQRAQNAEADPVVPPGQPGILRRIDRPARRRQLKIALIRQSFRFDGGGEQIVSRIDEVLRRNGHQVTLIARKWDGVEANVLKCDPPRWTRIQRESRFAREAMRLARMHQFDLVQSHERIPGCQIYRAGDGVHQSWLEQRSRGWPAWRKHLLRWSPFHRYLLDTERRMLEHPRLRMVICNSHMVATEIFERFRIHPAKLRVIYNGVDTHRFHPYLKHQRQEICHRYQLPHDRSLALFVGSGWERKGLTQVLEALHRVDNMSLLVVGRDKSQRWFEQMSAWLGLSDRVRFVGAQPDVTPFYGAADVLVLPTLYDPFPNAVMEAMAAGLPVLTSHKCGGAELITQCRNGIVFDALDFKSLINSLDYCCDRERCREMGVHARRTIEPFTFDKMERELSELYGWLLRDKSP